MNHKDTKSQGKAIEIETNKLACQVMGAVFIGINL